MSDYDRDYNSPARREEDDGSPAKKRRYDDRDGGRGHRRGGERGETRPLVKILVPNYAAGAIIGKRGQTMRDMEEKFSCKIKISPSGKVYPGIGERVVVLVGEVSQILELNTEIMEKVQSDAKHAGDNNRSNVVKMIVPNLTAGLIIGKGGETIKKIQQDTSAKVIVNSPQDCPVRNERIVAISGTREQRIDACREVMTRIAPDAQNIKLNSNVNYEDDGNDGGRRDGRDGYDNRNGGGGGGLPDGFGNPGALNSILGGPSPGLLAGLAQQQPSSFGSLGGGGLDQLRGLGGGIPDIPRVTHRSAVKKTAQLNIDVPAVVFKYMSKRGNFDDIKNFSGANIHCQYDARAGSNADQLIQIFGEPKAVEMAHSLVDQRIEAAENEYLSGGR